ncbi:MAG TPA: NYN domain-containing protein [Acidimicrobiales bacterium]|nr:NYN domain-containing protein [Acidimicrobiales bacterium]
MDTDEERIALFLDYENLAIGARDALGGLTFDLKPVLDALAERGRVIARKAYADWSSFDEDRRMLTRGHVELVEIPQRMGTSRKNAADIKLAVDALEMAFERDYVTTFVICTGDSDLTPLVHKLRELNKRVIGVGIKDSTSALLPPACDEFLFYDTLEGVDVPAGAGRRRGGGRGGRSTKKKGTASGATEDVEPVAEQPPADLDELVVRVVQTVAGLQRSSSGNVLASSVKRALLRKDPTFSEAEYGFRAFGELLDHLAERNVIELSEGSAKGDPEVSLPAHGGETAAFALLASVIAEMQGKGTVANLSGLKNQVRKIQPGFSEKAFGYGGFLQFAKAAATQGVITLEWDPEDGDYVLGVPTA